LTEAVPRALVPALKDLMRWLTHEQIPGAIVGAVAASVRGKPRHTDDVDAVVFADDMRWDRVLESAGRYGFIPRIEDALGFAAHSHVLLLKHEPSGTEVDISLGALPFEREIVERSSMVKVGRLQLRLTSAEDLIIMKSLARRPRDIADIEGLLTTNPDLDLNRIRHHLRDFSSVLEMPEIYEDFEKLLRSMRRR
jgi:hypothetical protein